MKYLLSILGSLILTGIAIFLVVMAGMHYGATSPQFITAIIGTVIVILLLVWLGSKVLNQEIKPKTLANGLPALATVIRSYQSGQAISSGGAVRYYQLVIEVNVTNPQGETWPAKMKEMINITQIGMFQPGVSFKVLYDPNNKSKVVFDQNTQQQVAPYGNTAGFGQNYTQVFSNSQANKGQQVSFGSVNVPGFGTVDSIMANEVLKHRPQGIVLQLQATSALLNELNASSNAVAAEATVISKAVLIENFMNGADVFKLSIRVNPKNASPFEADTVILIQKPSIYKIEPGKTVYVKYDPNNPQRMAMTGTDKPDSAVAL